MLPDASTNTEPPASQITDDKMSQESVDAALAILHECGEAIRSCWTLFNNHVRSFLYLNVILFAAFSFFLQAQQHGFNLHTLAAAMVAAQHWSVGSQAPSNPSAEARSGKKGQPASDTTPPLARLISSVAAGLGIAGAIAAFVGLRRMTKHSRRILERANSVETYLLRRLDLPQEDLGFFKFVYESEKADQKKPNMVLIGLFMYGFFILCWVAALLVALGCIPIDD